MRTRYRPGRHIVIGTVLVLTGASLQVVGAALHSRWWLAVAGAALVGWLVVLWIDVKLWRRCSGQRSEREVL